MKEKKYLQMGRTLILNANIVNEGGITESDLLIEDERISRIDSDLRSQQATTVIDAQGKYLLPGIIDDQVHFREPGLTHKATIASESRAAVAGGITSYMEMPNTIPNALTQELLEEKYRIASQTSAANYSFFMGASNDNLDEILKTDPKKVCGIKIFMGSSTGNMLVDNIKTLEDIFSQSPTIIATHCEDEDTIKANSKAYREKYGDDMPIRFHPEIRSVEACFKSSSLAVDLAKKYNSRLHILHISTAKELELFENITPLKDKKITSEACIHHMWFSNKDYDDKGTLIKWNPAIKSPEDRDAIFEAMKDGTIDVVATDHAPHTIEEKNNNYWNAPSGGPLVQHSLVAMLEFFHNGKISIEKVVEKMCHNPAILFRIKDRGYIREGYFADLVLVDPNDPWTVHRSNILAKCGWSPFEGRSFHSKVVNTWVSGNLVYQEGIIKNNITGKRLAFYA